MFKKRGRLCLNVAAGLAGLATAGLFTSAALPAPQAKPAAKLHAQAKQPKLHLSTRADVVRYLRSKGIAPGKAVFQQGRLNYAGPNCPGKAWNCTRAQVVVQLAADGGDNSFECSPTGTGTSPPNTCVVVQGSSTSNSKNEARCKERSTTPGVVQSCDITQTNGTGDNRATIDQRIDLNGGSTQGGTQTGHVVQVNGTGTNFLHAEQRISEDTHDLATSGDQTQQGDQSLVACQGGANSPGDCTAQSTGDNTAEIIQSLHQHADAKAAGAISQQQNASAPNGFNVVADVGQNSSIGKNKINLDQRSDQDGHATSNAGPVNQTQGNFSGGLLGELNQFSHGVSEVNANQNEDQKLHADAPATTVDQTQIGPVNCCSDQADNPKDKFKIDQRSKQRAKINGDDGDRIAFTDQEGGGTFQSDTIRTDCDSSGRCDASSTIDQQGQKSTFTCNDTSCHATNNCSAGECFVNTCGEGCGGGDRAFRPVPTRVARARALRH